MTPNTSRKLPRDRLAIVLVSVVCPLLILVGCGMQPVTSPLPPPTATPRVIATIPFETIDLWPPDVDGSFPECLGNTGIERPISNGQVLDASVLGPQVALITRNGDYAELVGALPRETPVAIQSIDFGRFLVLVYWYGGTGPEVWSVVENLYLDEQGVRVAAHTWVPPETGLQPTVMENPFHIIKVDRSSLLLGDSGNALIFRLIETRDIVPNESTPTP